MALLFAFYVSWSVYEDEIRPCTGQCFKGYKGLPKNQSGTLIVNTASDFETSSSFWSKCL